MPSFDCLQVFELKRAGWTKDARGPWTSPTLAAQAEQMVSRFRAAA
jgi:hypothetical protein